MNSAKLSLFVALLAFVGGSASQLHSVFAGVPHEATIIQIICGVSGYSATLLGVWLAWLVRQEGQVNNVVEATRTDPGVQETMSKAVSRIPGVVRLLIDKRLASQPMSLLADNPHETKFQPTL